MPLLMFEQPRLDIHGSNCFQKLTSLPEKAWTQGVGRALAISANQLDLVLHTDRSCVRRGNRNLQFFLKYFTANSIIIVVILVVQDLVPAVRAVPPFYGVLDKNN